MEILRNMTVVEKTFYFAALVMFIVSLCLGWRWYAPLLFFAAMVFAALRSYVNTG